MPLISSEGGMSLGTGRCFLFVAWAVGLSLGVGLV